MPVDIKSPYTMPKLEWQALTTEEQKLYGDFERWWDNEPIKQAMYLGLCKIIHGMSQRLADQGRIDEQTVIDEKRIV